MKLLVSFDQYSSNGFLWRRYIRQCAINTKKNYKYFKKMTVSSSLFTFYYSVHKFVYYQNKFRDFFSGLKNVIINKKDTLNFFFILVTSLVRL